MEYLGLYNKPKAAVHPGHKLMGPKEEEEIHSYRCENLKICRVIVSVPTKEMVFVLGKICTFPESRGGARD
jgi:hypothetical protein